MGIEVGFYHCTRAPAREVAVRLAAKAYASGERLLVVGAADQLAALDRALWVTDPDSFLAHGLAGSGEAAAHPILLSETPEPANGAGMLMLLETGLPASFESFARILNLFDDGSEAHTRARADWKLLGGRESVTRTYWQQKDGGGWEKRG